MTTTDEPHSDGLQTLLAMAKLLLVSHDQGRATDLIRVQSDIAVRQWLGLVGDLAFAPYVVQLLFAVQLSPFDAIAYDPANPTPRWRLVRDHLVELGVQEGADLDATSRLVAIALDHWDVERRLQPAGRTMSSRCELCGLAFVGVPESVATNDPYKPTASDPDEFTRPEVDHIIPISWVGTNDEENLQVICRACNMAKSDGFVLDPRDELRNARRPLEEISRGYLFRLLVWSILDREGRCDVCGDRTTRELTIRPRTASSALTRRSVTLVCYGCLDDESVRATDRSDRGGRSQAGLGDHERESDSE